MILAANLNLDTIIYIAAAVWGVVSWWRNKGGVQTEEEGGEMPRQTEVRRPVAPQQTESEEERLRRFLEALGVPGGQERPKPVQAPVVRKPEPRREAPRFPDAVRPPQPAQRPIPRPAFQPRKPRPAPVPEPEEMALAGRLEEPAASIEGVGAEFDRMSGGVVLPAMEALATRPDVAAFAEVSGASQTQPTAVTTKSIHTALRSPDSLRTAFVLREVLGPPRSEAV